MKRKLKSLLKLSLVVAIAVIAYFAHKYEWLQRTILWVESFETLAPFVFVATYTLSVILFVPAIFFSFAGGIMFGPLGGTALSVIGLALGAVSSFLIGRYIARNKIRNYFEHNEKFQLIDHAIHQKGWKVILLARLTPIFPFMIANYGFGLTKLKARHYFAASLIGSIPGTAVIAYAGSLAGDFSQSGVMNHERTPAEWSLLIGGLIITIVLAWYLKRLATKALTQQMPSDIK